MLQYIEKVPILHYSIKETDLEKIKFPAITEEILDIRLENKETGEVLTYKDNVFAGAENVKAKKEEIIYIKYIMKKVSDIEIVLEISDIFQYSCGVKTIMELRAIGGRYDYGFGGSRVDIMDRSCYIDNNNPSRLFIHLRDDIIAIDANKAVIKDVKYIEKNNDN